MQRPHLFGVIAGLFLSAGLVLAAMVVTRAWMKVHESATIEVMGAAHKPVVADLIIWGGWFQSEGPNLETAQQQWTNDLVRVRGFMEGQGITNYVFKPVTISEVRSRANEYDTEAKVVGFRLRQGVEFESTDVEKVTEVGQAAVNLIKEGVYFTAERPDFIYTKAAEDKIALLAAATKDARVRAQQICDQGGRKLGDMRSARMGVFQITPRHSTETSSEGMNDTANYEKTIRAVVSVSFALE